MENSSVAEWSSCTSQKRSEIHVNHSEEVMDTQLEVYILLIEAQA